MKPNWIKREQIANISLKCNRSGVIPYLVTNKGIWFCLGKDKINGELSDFAGNRSIFDRSSEDTALKNCRSESLSVFDFSCVDLQVMDSLYIFDDQRLIILVDVTNWGKDMNYYAKEFDRKSLTASSSQFSELVWVNASTITEIISKKLTGVQSEVRSHIRDISKIIPIINYDRGKEIVY